MQSLLDKPRIARISLPCETGEQYDVHIHIDIHQVDVTGFLRCSLLLHIDDTRKTHPTSFTPKYESLSIFPALLTGYELQQFADEIERLLAERQGSARLCGFETRPIICLTYYTGFPDEFRVGGNWSPFYAIWLDKPTEDNFCWRELHAMQLRFDSLRSRHRLDLETYAKDIRRFIKDHDVSTEFID